MSEKMTCPACGVRLSAVLQAFNHDEPCPSCGLSAEAANEILGIRAQRAAEHVEKRAVAAIERADRAEAELRQLRRTVEMVRWALDGANADDMPYFD